MSDVITRAATRADLPRLTEIYSYNIVNTPITFDIEPYTVEQREERFSQSSDSGRNLLPRTCRIYI